MFYKNKLSVEDKKKLSTFEKFLKDETDTMVGYPFNLSFDYSELNPFFKYDINNLGDPFEKTNIRMNTHEFEKEVISFFSEITQIPKDDAWGYVTNGGTEGNLYGLLLGREIYPNSIIYYSDQTHYSVCKNIRLLNASNVRIACQKNGEMNYEDLKDMLKLHRDKPAIIFVTAGTTMTGAIDNIDEIKKILKELAIKNFYIHVDAALSGMILPFVEKPEPWCFVDGIDSISISGHKMIGSPIPCGVVLTKKSYMHRIAESVEYVQALDTTINGSRNGITPLFLWYAIKRQGYDGFKKMAEECISTAQQSVEIFKEHGIEAWRNNNSITVLFPKPSNKVLEKWQIATYGNQAHIITMPNIKIETIKMIAKDL
jgi:histidine decarboxylase